MSMDVGQDWALTSTTPNHTALQFTDNSSNLLKLLFCVKQIFFHWMTLLQHHLHMPFEAVQYEKSEAAETLRAVICLFSTRIKCSPWDHVGMSKNSITNTAQKTTNGSLVSEVALDGCWITELWVPMDWGMLLGIQELLWTRFAQLFQALHRTKSLHCSYVLNQGRGRGGCADDTGTAALKSLRFLQHKDGNSNTWIEF